MTTFTFLSEGHIEKNCFVSQMSFVSVIPECAQAVRGWRVRMQVMFSSRPGAAPLFTNHNNKINTEIKIGQSDQTLVGFMEEKFAWKKNRKLRGPCRIKGCSFNLGLKVPAGAIAAQNNLHFINQKGISLSQTTPQPWQWLHTFVPMSQGSRLVLLGLTTKINNPKHYLPK